MEHITVHAIYLLSIAVDLANAAVEELKSKNKQGKNSLLRHFNIVQSKTAIFFAYKKKSLHHMLKILFSCALA